MATVSAKRKTEEVYHEGVGGRKTAVARVRIWPAKTNSTVINSSFSVDEYFPTLNMRQALREPLERIGDTNHFKVSIVVRGGGKSAQAEAARHGLSRALVSYDKEFRTLLKRLGFLKRDPRMRERKKFGLKRARRARQWRKR
ncbi:MAG: 30S ribosomal protein S9 [bacterium]|nr:30S ribosomal protein S9 [bacterium]